MSDIAQIRANKALETENTKQSQELRKLRADNMRTYQKVVSDSGSEVERIQKDHDTFVSNLKNESEQKLREMRERYTSMQKEENERLENELQDLKSIYKDKKGELAIGHQNEIDRMNQSHRETLENAKRKFVQEKAKYTT